MFLKLLLLIIGVFCCSTSVIFIKLSSEHPILLAAYRLLLASIVLTPAFLKGLKTRGEGSPLFRIRSSLLPGVVLGLHFIAWNIGARMTLAANSTLIVNMVPVVMPFLLFLFSGEVINRREILGTSVAMAGVILLGSVDVQINRTTFFGDLACFLSMLLFALYLALAKRNKSSGSIWLYVVPLYYVAGAFCFIVGIFFQSPIKPYSVEELLYIIGLAVVPTVVGHSTLNYSMQQLRGQLVSIAILSQFVFAGVLGFVLLGETPHPFFYLSSGLLVGGAVVMVLPLREITK
jgi:drug/metabolite transporter (DMT)-like permease